MGNYNLSAEEIAEKIIEAIEDLEGDYTNKELKKAFKLVELDQRAKCNFRINR
jgi:hypothetical protein